MSSGVAQLVFRISFTLLLVGMPLGRALAQPSGPGEAPRVRIQRPLQGDELIDVAVVRILGELSAVGLDVEVLHRGVPERGVVPPLEDGTYGMLAVRREQQWIELDTWAPDGGAAYTQRLDASDPQTTAEVIAVRAVEALRAKWLEYAELSNTALPSEVEQLTVQAPPPEPEPEPKSEPAPPAAPPTPEQPRPAPPETTPVADAPDPQRVELPPTPKFDTGRWTVQLLLGPNLTLEGEAGSNIGLQGGALLGTSGLHVGVSIHSSLQRPEVSAAVGRAEIDRTRYLGMVRGELELGRSATAYGMVGVGVARFAINGTKTGGEELEARDALFHRLCGSLQGGSVLWLTQSFGLFGEAEVSGLAEQMVIRMDEQAVHTFGTPTAAFGMGILLRQPIQ